MVDLQILADNFDRRRNEEAVTTDESGGVQDRCPDTTAYFPGVGVGSPLCQAITHRLRHVTNVSAAPDWPTPSSAWRKMVAGTALQWWSDADQAVEQSSIKQAAELVVDLHGHDVVPSNHVWRVVDVAGNAILSPFALLEYCWRLPGVVSLFLIESKNGGANWMVLSEVHLSGLQNYRHLLRGVCAAVPALLAAGFHPLSRTTECKEWHPAKRRARGLARLEYLFLKSAALCKAYMTAEIWAIGVLQCRIEDLFLGGTISPENWLQIPEREGYVADPFPWPGRADVILCELYRHGTGRGSIQSLTVDDGHIIAVRDVSFDVESHLSYPFTFEENGRVFCLPEMGASRRQLMYELRQGASPLPVCVVAEDKAMADATLFRHDGFYYIAYTDTEIGLHDNLCLLWATSLAGPWLPHSRNPVKMDVRSSRCGGTPFHAENWLVRPAQNCAGTYGSALALNRVIKCTPDEYHEEPIAWLVPDKSGPFPSGLHTLSSMGTRVLVDGKKIVFRPGVVLQRIRRRLTSRRAATRKGAAGRC